MHAENDERLPSVAVCVPAYGDDSALERLLESVAAVHYPAPLLQVIVVVDGPDATLVSVARHHGAEVVELPVNRGSYAARNAAIAAVGRSSWAVLFADTDVVVGPEWVREHVTALQHADMSAGAVRFRFSTPVKPAEYVDAVRHLNQRLFAEALGYGATANLAVRREVLSDVTFDGSLRSGGDRDFGRRARDAGFSLAYTERAWVLHPARASVRQLFAKVNRIARGIEQLRAKNIWSKELEPYRRGSAVARAHREKVSRGPAWDLSVWTLDHICDLIWAFRAPSNILPALGRRLRALRLALKY